MKNPVPHRVYFVSTGMCYYYFQTSYVFRFYHLLIEHIFSLVIKTSSILTRRPANKKIETQTSQKENRKDRVESNDNFVINAASVFVCQK